MNEWKNCTTYGQWVGKWGKNFTLSLPQKTKNVHITLLTSSLSIQVRSKEGRVLKGMPTAHQPLSLSLFLSVVVIIIIILDVCNCVWVEKEAQKVWVWTRLEGLLRHRFSPLFSFSTWKCIFSLSPLSSSGCLFGGHKNLSSPLSPPIFLPFPTPPALLLFPTLFTGLREREREERQKVVPSDP